MVRLIPILFLLLSAFIGSATTGGRQEASRTIKLAGRLLSIPLEPAMNLAPEFRERNWTRRGRGSCVHATTIMLLRWQGLHDKAAEWKAKYGGAENPEPHREKLELEGLKFAMTTDGDVALLEYALENRLGAGVSWPCGPRWGHCVALVGKQNGYAVILDNNSPNQYKYVLWDQFVSEWRECGGWAFVIIGDPPPPLPVVSV